MGYFRIFYYITYILNFLLRLIKRHGKAILWFICIFIFLVLCLYNPKSQAIYIGDYTYGDVNYAVNDFYNKINIDFIRRLNNYSGDNKNLFIDRIKTSQYSFYLYYGSFNGLDNISGQNYNTNNLRIFIYRNDFVNSSSISPSVYDNYCGISPVDIKLLNSNNYYLYYFDGAGNLNLYSNSGSYSVTMPSTLINYMNDYTYNYLFNNYSLQEIEILMEMDEKLSSVDETLQQQQEYLEQEPDTNNFSNSDLPSDSGVTDSTTTAVDNIFTTFYNVFTGNVEATKRNITVTIPFTRKEFQNTLYFNK